MKEDIDNTWKVIHQILDHHDYPTHESGVVLNFNSTKCNYLVDLQKARD